jgi:phage terminase large subunit-like protein
MSASVIIDRASMARWRADPIRFIETVLYDPETDQPFKLLPAEKQFLAFVFKLDDDGRLMFPELVFGAIKKSGKTTLAAIIMLAMVLLFGGRFAEGYCIANDLEQAQSRVFAIVKRIVQASPLLKREARITADRVVFAAFFDATIIALASGPAGAAGAAGANPVITCVDEPWGVTSESGYRLFEEMIPPPTRKIACRLSVSYAGFEGDSKLLEALYKRGMALPEVGPSLRAGDGMLFAWHHEPIAPWQTEAWLSEMRRSLRPNQYLRMIENRWVTSESSFVDLSKWDRCVDPRLGHVVTDHSLPIYIGVDASTKRDQSAVVAVMWDQAAQQVRLVTHVVFQPSPDDPLDFESTIERSLLDLHKRFSIRQILFDPWQMQATAQRLTRAGLPIVEFPQSSPNLTSASQNLYELIEGQNIVAYPDAGMRLAISRAVAVETPRGWRISKEKQSHKIDVVVALAMACHAAVQSQNEPGYSLAAFSDGFVDLDRPSVPGSLPNRTEDLATALHAYIGLHKRWI